MLALSALWTLLLVVELTRGLTPWLQVLSDVIWILFIAQFAIEFVGEPSKRVYLRKRWITAVSLAALVDGDAADDDGIGLLWRRTRSRCSGTVTAAIAAYFIGKDRKTGYFA